MIRRSIILVAGLLGMASAQPALAHSGTTPGIFSAQPVADSELGAARGAASPYAALSRGSLSRLSDAQSRSDFRVTGTISTLQMEVWWGTIGSELIANAVRNRFQ